jgi:hypothetical protein
MIRRNSRHSSAVKPSQTGCCLRAIIFHRFLGLLRINNLRSMDLGSLHIEHIAVGIQDLKLLPELGG